MKSITLMRHARPERDSPTGRDFDRTLDERGRADAARLGREIREGGLEFGLVLVSPAQRAMETVEAVGGLAPTRDERIYNATAGELLGIVQDVAGEIDRLLLIGHNPGFEELASMLAGCPIGMSAGALVEIELPIDNWRDAGTARGHLVRFINPKEWD